MKYTTLEEINQLKTLMMEKRELLRVLMKELDSVQERLHACKTHEEIDAVEADYRDSIKTAEDILKFIRKAKKQIAKFYAAPAA